MEGNKTAWGYINSFKWQPTVPKLLGGNVYVPFSGGKVFSNIPSSAIKYPSGIFSLNGAWRGLIFGQKMYNPGAAGIPAWIFDAAKYGAYGSGQAYPLSNQDCGCK